MSYMTGDFPVTADGKNVGWVKIEQNGLLLVFNCTCNYRTHDVVRLAAVCHGSYVPLGVMTPVAEVLQMKRSYSKHALVSMGYDNTALFHLIKPGDIYSESPGGESALVSETDEPDVSDTPPAQAPDPVLYNDFPDPADYIDDYADDSDNSALMAEDAADFPECSDDQQEPELALADSGSEPPITPSTPAEETAKLTETADGWLVISDPGMLFDDGSIQEACAGISNALVMEQDGCLLLAVPILPAEPFPLMPVFCFGSSGEAGGQECIIFKIKNGNLIL